MKLTPTLLLASTVSALIRSSTPAPYLRSDTEHLVPEGYIVRFQPNHTLEDHINNICFDVHPFASVFVEMKLSNAFLLELSVANNSLIHDSIRYDLSVLRVEHDEYLHDEDVFVLGSSTLYG